MRIAQTKVGNINAHQVEATMRQQIGAQAGFTLVELLMAIVLLAVGLLSLAQLQVTAMRTTTNSAGMMGANALAQRIEEEIMSFPPNPAKIKNEDNNDFLSSTMNNRGFIYRDLRSASTRNYSNLIVSDNVGAGQTNQITSGIYQVTYSTVPDYTGMAAAGQAIRVCRIDVTIRDLSASNSRRLSLTGPGLRFTVYKNWSP